MHDTIRIESYGIPAVSVATNQFMNAARTQAAQLGRPDHDAIYVRHPIQDQTPDEVRLRADETIEEIVSRLTGPFRDHAFAGV